jgi:hypothetical protein
MEYIIFFAVILVIFIITGVISIKSFIAENNKKSSDAVMFLILGIIAVIGAIATIDGLIFMLW